MKEIYGDLLTLAANGQFDVIVHGCNCQCTMGRGIALNIRTQFPAAYEADCKTKKGDNRKLGTYTSATVNPSGHAFTIINAYTQFDWKNTGVKISYQAVEDIFHKVKQDFSGLRIGYPLIGAGMARGDWGKIRLIINTALKGENHTLVHFQDSTHQFLIAHP